MLAKYKKDAKGRLVKVADIYTVNEHGLKRQCFDEQAVDICRKLWQDGFEAFIVGGAVRDLLLGLTPKDFDIATNAHPAKVRKLFRQARVIGQRFKLVHITGSSGQIFEVATFRSADPDESNVYGTLDEDAFRRDFTLNALYYNPMDEKIIDFHRGYQHIKNHQIEAVVPLSYSFTEDPVRMIRAIKYAQTTNSKLSNALQSAIKHHAKELSRCSHSRLSEELIKVLANRCAKEILESCYDFLLLANWLPNLNAYLGRLDKAERKNYWQSLNQLNSKEERGRGRMLFALLGPYVKEINPVEEGNSDAVFNTMKIALSPIVLPNRDIIEATHLCFIDAGLPWKIEEDSIIFSKNEKRRYTRKVKT